MENGGKKKEQWNTLSLIGSVSSMAALAIILIEKAMVSANANPQQAVWRTALLFICFLAIGATIVIVYNLFRSMIISSEKALWLKTLLAFIILGLGIIVLAVFIDGFFAIIYWRWWFGGIVQYF